jgi:hypothetical protein
VEWIYITQVKGQWRAVSKKVMNKGDSVNT